MIEEANICSTVNAKLNEEFRKTSKPEVKLQKSINNSLGKDVPGSMAQLNALYRSVGFSDTASVCVFRKAVPENQDMAQFAIVRLPVDYVGLIKAIKDLLIGQKMFYGEESQGDSLRGTPDKIIQITDASSSRHLENKLDQPADLSLLAKKQFENESPPVKMDADCSCGHCNQKGHGATRYPPNPRKDTRCSDCGRRGL